MKTIRRTFNGGSRFGKAAASSLVSTIAKATTVVASLITIPLTSSYLGPERFGVWMTLVSFAALTAFADFGVGNGLINMVAAAEARNDRVAVRRNIANCLLIVFLGGIFLFVIAAVAARYIGVTRIFGLKSPALMAEVESAFLLYAALICSGLLLSVVQKIRIGLQQGYKNGLWNIGSSLIGLSAIFVAVHLRADLRGLVFALIGLPLVSAFLHFCAFFARRRAWAIPRLDDFDLNTARALLGVGSMFFLLQLIAGLTTSIDNLVISNVLGASAVGDYAIVARLFSLSSIAAGLLLQPLWPAYADARERQDFTWIRRALTVSSAVVLSIAIAVSVLLLVGHNLISMLWLGRELEVDGSVLIGFACWSAADALGMALATYLNGVSILWPQVLAGLIAAGSSLVLKVFLLPQFGLAVLPWVAAVVGLVVSCIPMMVLAAYQLKGIWRNWAAT